MAYNLQPLITILEQILNPEQTRWVLDDHNEPQLESLLLKAVSLQQIVEESMLPEIEGLESQIREAAHKAEDMIESHMVHQLHRCPEGARLTFIAPDLQQVTEELDSAVEQVAKLVKLEGNKMPGGSSLSTRASSFSSLVVGVDEDLVELKDRLTGMQRKLEIIPIIGIGGIGKTTLARKLYQDTSIASHFQYARAWATISQAYNMKATLSSLLRCIIGKEFDDEHIGKEGDELKDILYKSLYGRRYMIVLDDVWSTNFWDDIRRYFPENNNGSRIVITTRELDVAKYADSQSRPHQVQLLSESESWNLLRQIVFGEEENGPDDELQGIGEKIAIDCGGLPLAINVIGGLLSKVERSRNAWENVGNDVRVSIVESDEQFYSILSLSYNHLPNHLKPCFLYMGAFPEDYEVDASEIIWLWVAEGFVKSNGNNANLEEEADSYLNTLVARNLLFVTQKEFNVEPKTYSMHDLFRELCINKSNEEKFLHVAKNSSEVSLYNVRRVSVSVSYGMEGYLDFCTNLKSIARTFLCIGRLSIDIPSPLFSALSLLRVLDVMDMNYPYFPIEILQLVNLRYLAISCASGIPWGISRLSNLQTLIANVGTGDVAYEVWELPELRHLKVSLFYVEKGYMIHSVRNKLQTLSFVSITPSHIRNGFFDNFPNITLLAIYIDELPSTAVDLSHLHKLRTLTCESSWDEDSCRFLPTLMFPPNLTKLILVSCVIYPEVLTTLCALPNLVVLEIHECSFERQEDRETDVDEWEAKEGDEFRTLQFLSLVDLNLMRWRADETNYPRLRHLSLNCCRLLEEIPGGIGEISTLQIIELQDCSDSAVESAKQIVEAQQSEYANYDIQLRISYS